PALSAANARVSAERSAIRAQYSPDNPKVGFMREKDMNLMEQQMGPMNSWSVSQEIKFPTKYFLMGAAQSARADAAEQAFQEKRLEIRGKVISAYFGLYAADRIISLYEAQKETLREVARIAESRYATGSVSQQDQMKAHVEQAKVENEILMARQERETMAAMLNAVLNREASEEIALPSQDLRLPRLESVAAAGATENITKDLRKTSKRINASEFTVKGASINKALVGWTYAPDINFLYRKPFTVAQADAYSFSVELSIPFWFFLKQTSECSSASAAVIEAEKMRDATIRETEAESKALLSKVKTNENLLKIYETSLIPLVTNTLNSSRAAYRAGRASFIELLDSERALYETRIGFYRTLTQYVDALVRLEQITGQSLSSLPMGDST
ncbi:MAG: hypothetical protein A3K03_06725, partial [Bdellovibrionales bacterium RIFOXYD1_FULL_44_7]